MLLLLLLSLAIHCSWQCLGWDGVWWTRVCAQEWEGACARTHTRSTKKHWPEMCFCRNDLKMPRDHIIQSSSCTSFEYANNNWCSPFFQFSKERLSNHISLARVSINYISKSTVHSDRHRPKWKKKRRQTKKNILLIFGSFIFDVPSHDLKMRIFPNGAMSFHRRRRRCSRFPSPRPIVHHFSCAHSCRSHVSQTNQKQKPTTTKTMIRFFIHSMERERNEKKFQNLNTKDVCLNRKSIRLHGHRLSYPF